MRLVHLEDVAVVLPGRTLFEHATWSIFRGERYGLVGANGAGKTTLLRLIIGEFEFTSGSLAKSRDLSVGYLPQEGITHVGRSLFEEAWTGLPDIPRIEKEIERLRREVAERPEDADVAERLGVLQHRWEDLEGYHAEAKVSRVLSGLGFRESDYARAVEEFSGGWQMRIALAELLLFDPDLLLLDEPTNHLDLSALLWLENYLLKYSGALVIVSHDRDFLDRMVRRIAELDHRELTLYPGSYTEYEDARTRRRDQLEAEAARLESERERIEAFIERFRYKATKARQVQSRIKQLGKLPVVETRSSARRVHFRFPSAPASGRIVLELKDVGKRYGKVNVFGGVNLVLSRGEKAALVGVNGAGKSTLCRLIAGVEDVTSGEIRLGHQVAVDYFAQEADFHLDARLSILQQMEAEAGSVSQAWLRGLLGAFLFSGDDVFKPISVLSGGEKSRLALAKILLHPSNFIILDEPTNHLDLASQDVLLDSLREYEGTLLIVSHDRYFLDRLVDRVLELENGELRDWPGNLSEYITRKGLIQSAQADEKVVAERVPVTSRPIGGFKTREQKRAEAEIRNRHSVALGQTRHEVSRVQQAIEQAENRKREIEARMSDESFYRDGERCRELLTEYGEIRARIPLLLEQWAEAAARLEQLEKLKIEELRTL